MNELKSSVEKCDDFLSPVLCKKDEHVSDNQNTNQVIKKLYDKCADASKNPPNHEIMRARVVQVALNLLQSIQTAVCKWENSQRVQQEENFILGGSSPVLRSIYFLLDLIVVEAFYPILQVIIKLPFDRRGMSVIYRNQTLMESEDSWMDDDKILKQKLFNDSLERINQMLYTGNKLTMFGQVVVDQSLMDLLNANGLVCFVPNSVMEEWNGLRQTDTGLGLLVSSVQVSRLLPSLMGLVGASMIPKWLRDGFSGILSSVPTKRKDGIRHTIDFIASMGQCSGSETGINKNSKMSLIFTPHVLEQCARLVSAVPRNVTGEEHIKAIREQLYDLLDGEKGEDYRIVAGFIINKGILSQKKFDTVGWKYLAEPILLNLNPELEKRLKGDYSCGHGSMTKGIVVCGSCVKRSLSRLTMIIKSKVNPNVSKRLLHRVRTSLWTLYIISRECEILETGWYEQSKELVKLIFDEITSREELIECVNLFILGTQEKDQWWTFCRESSGDGIEMLCEQTDNGFTPENPLVKAAGGLQWVNQNVELFDEMLKGKENYADATVEVFFYALQIWLCLEPSESDTVLRQIYGAAIAKRMMDSAQDVLRRSTTRLLEFVKVNLLSILKMSTRSRNEWDMEQDDSEMMLSLTIELLKWTIEQSNLHPQKLVSATKEIGDILRQIDACRIRLTGSKNENIEECLRKIQLMENILDSKDMDKTNTEKAVGKDARSNPCNSSVEKGNPKGKILEQIEESIEHAEPPIRVEGIQKLEKLARDKSKVIDDISISVLLLERIKRDDEEFVFLRAIQAWINVSKACIGSGTGKTIVWMAVSEFSDQQQGNSLDSRLRLAETVIRLMEEIKEDGELWEKILWNEAREDGVISMVYENGIKVASRRGKRFRELEEKLKKLTESERKVRQANEAWGGQVPDISELKGEPGGDEDGDDDKSNEQKKFDYFANYKGIPQETLDRILAGWNESSDQGEEDVRIRVSAVCLLRCCIASIFELSSLSSKSEVIMTPTKTVTACQVKNDGTLKDILDLVTGILIMEKSVDRAILRRAGTLILREYVAGYDRFLQARRNEVRTEALVKTAGSESTLNYADVNVDMVVQGLQSIYNVIKVTESMDEDPMVKDNAVLLRCELDEITNSIFNESTTAGSGTSSDSLHGNGMAKFLVNTKSYAMQKDGSIKAEELFPAQLQRLVKVPTAMATTAATQQNIRANSSNSTGTKSFIQEIE